MGLPEPRTSSLCACNSAGTTAEYSFHRGGKWVAAAELRVGDELLCRDGSLAAVAAVEAIEAGAWQAVYNLRVADYHTYFVGSAEWGFGVWAHNAEYWHDIALATEQEAVLLISSMSKKELGRRAAVSKAATANDASRFYHNMRTNANDPAVAKTMGLQRTGEKLEHLTITDVDQYMTGLHQMYTSSEQRLHPTIERKVREYLANRTTPLDWSRGLPGTHAEVQAVNDVLWRTTATDLADSELRQLGIAVATHKLSPAGTGQGQAFIACPNCTGILDDIVNVVTGVTR